MQTKTALQIRFEKIMANAKQTQTDLQKIKDNCDLVTNLMSQIQDKSIEKATAHWKKTSSAQKKSAMRQAKRLLKRKR
jgi:hypothetical protein